MDTGHVLGGALRLLRGRQVLGFGVLVALVGLVYAGAHLLWETYNPHYLSDLADTLETSLPPAFPAWVAGAAVLLVLGGLLSEGGLILAAGRRPAPAGQMVPAGGALRRLPALLGVAGIIWWPVLLGLALTAGPALYLIATSSDLSVGVALGLLTAVCGAGVVALLGALICWPQQRLANCALLLDGQRPGAAVGVGRRLYRQHFGAVFGLWSAVLLLNGLLLVLSALLAGLAAGVVAGVWVLLGGVPEETALLVVGALAVVLGVGLLLWDGAVSAFTIGAWVLAYRDLRPLPPSGA